MRTTGIKEGKTAGTTANKKSRNCLRAEHIQWSKDEAAIGELVEKQFGDKANPLYERLAKYFQILDSYGFVEWEVR